MSSADQMAGSALPTKISDCGGQLKRLAEEDHQDEVLIAEARKRIKLRDIERDSLRRTLTANSSAFFDSFSKEEVDATGEHAEEAFVHVESTKGDRIEFETVLFEFKEMCVYMGPEEILTCPLCMLHGTSSKSNKGNTPPLCQRVVCAYEKISDYLILADAQWQALLELWNLQTEDFDISQELGPGWGMHIHQERAGDIELLWASRFFAEHIPSISGDRSKSPPEASATSTDLFVPVPEGELSDDGFSDGSDRSYAYEQDSKVDKDSELAVTLQGVYAIDPRFQTSYGDTGAAEMEKACLNKVSLNEVKDLAEETRAIMHTSPHEQAVKAEILK